MANFCGKCGNPLGPDARFCPNCGAAIGNIPSVPPAQTSYVNTAPVYAPARVKKKSKAPIVIFILLLLCLVGAAAALTYFDVIDIPFISSLIGESGTGESGKDKTDGGEDSDKDGLSNGSGDDGGVLGGIDLERLAYDEESGAIYYKDMLIVYTLGTADGATAEKLAKAAGGTVEELIIGAINAVRIRVPETDLAELNSKADSLMKDSAVIYAGYEYPIGMTVNSAVEEGESASEPWSDSAASPESDRGNEDFPNGNDWWAEAVGAYTAWELSEAEQSLTVGILDSGFDTDHEELYGKLSFADKWSGNNEDDHGTHVAGLVGAKNNGVGIRGVSDGSSLFCADLTPSGESGSGFVSYIDSDEYLKITKYMIESGVRVLNNSWGTSVMTQDGYTNALYNDSGDIEFLLGYFAVEKTSAYDSYLNYLRTHNKRVAMDCMSMMIQLICSGNDDFLIVQAAGNGYSDKDQGIELNMNGFYCSLTQDVWNILSKDTRDVLTDMGITFKTLRDHIITVGAVKNELTSDGGYKMTSFSNYGSYLDICAPGDDIYSSVAGGGYKMLDGTSMAAPIVAGSAALVWSNDPELSAGEVKALLLDNCSTYALGVGSDSGTKYPMLDVGAAVEAVTGRILTPEEAVDIYMRNKSMWLVQPEYAPMAGYYYLFLDLDFDGNLELITSVNDGSMRLSTNRYFKIDLESERVYEIGMPTDDEFGGPDFSMSDQIKLTKNVETGIMSYYLCDFTRVSNGEYGRVFSSLRFEDDERMDAPLFFEYTLVAGAYGNNAGVEEYTVYTEDGETKVDKNIYGNAMQMYFTDNTDMKLTLSTVFGEELEQASETEQRNMLLSAYRAFSYDGFSFD